MSDKHLLLYEANRRGLLKGEKKAAYDEALRRGMLNVPGAPQYSGPATVANMRTFAKTGEVSMAPPPKTVPKPKVVKKPGLGGVQGRKGAVARAAAGEIVPTAGGIAGAATLGGLGATAGLATGPAAPIMTPVLGIGGALVGGFGGARLAADAQQAVLDMLPPEIVEALGQSDDQRRKDAEAYPVSTFAARAAPSLVTGRPTKAVGETVANALMGGGLEAGMEAYQGDVDLRKVAVAAGLGAAGAKPNALGRAINGAPTSALDDVLIAGRKRSGRDKDPVSLKAAPVLQSVGIKPAAVDVIPDSALVEVARAAEVKEPVRAAAAKHTRAAALQTPGAGKTAARLAVPEMGGETATSRRKALEDAVTTAEEGAAATRPPVPDVETAAGGQSISERLNREYDEAYARRGAAYKEAEDAGPAYFEDLTPGAEKPRGEMGHWQPVEQGGEAGFMLPTGEFKPAGAVGPLGPAAVAEAVRTKLNEGSHLAKEAPEYGAIQRIVDKIATAKTANDLYAHRRMLSDITVEAEKAGNTSIAAAARTAKNALDDQLDQLAAAGRFTDEFGYPEGAAVEKWTSAIAEGREFAKQYRGNDVIEELTRREYSGGTQAPRLNPDAVTARLIGKGPTIVLRQDGSRELAALRRRLGENSPEWQALRTEAAGRILGAKDPAAALAQLEAKTPKAVVDMLITPDERALIAQGPQAAEAAAKIKAEADVGQQAINAGEAFATTLATDFRRALEGLGPRELRDARVAMRTAITSALQTPQKSNEYLRDLVQNDEARANVVALLGREEGAKLLKRADAISDRYGRAAALSPPRVVGDGHGGVGELVAGVAAEAATHGITGGGAYAAASAGTRSMMSRLRGLGMSEAKARELAQQAFDPERLPEVMDRVRQLYGENAAQAFLRRLRAQTAKNAPLQRVIVQVAAPAAEKSILDVRAVGGEGGTDDTEEEEAGLMSGDADTEGLDPGLVIQAIGGQEGTGRNPNSTAVGPYQFIDSTFTAYAAQVAPDLVAATGLDPKNKDNAKAIASQLRGQMVDGVPIEELMMKRMTQDNLEKLQGAGLPANLTSLYLSHFAGPGGALKALQADPNASISEVLDAGAIAANAGIKFKGKTFAQFTAQDLIDWARAKMNAQLGRLAPAG